jgi:copper transport protein
MAMTGVVVFAILAWAGAASAHTVFEGSDPPDGASLAVSPRTVSLAMNSDIDVSLARVQLTDGARHNLPIERISVDETRPTRLIVQLGSLPPETYRLSFSIRDSVDLHVTASSIVFGVSTVPSLKATRPPSRGPDGSEVALRWLARSGLAVLLGALTVMLLVVPQAFARTRTVSGLQRRLVDLALAGVVTAAVGDTALLCLQATQIGPLGPTFSRLLSQSDFGRRWLIGMQLSVGLLLLLWWLRRQTGEGKSVHLQRASSGRRSWYRVSFVPLAICLLAVAQTVAVGVSGHTGGSSSPTGADVGLRAIHLVSVGAWVGGLVALVIVLVTLRRGRAGPGADSATLGRTILLRRFSAVAATGMVVVVVSGLLMTGDQVQTVTALLTTRYGIILLLKVAVVGGVALLGLRHAWLVARRVKDPALDRRLRRSLPLEAVGGLIVVLLGAALGATAPARGPQFGPRPARSPAVITSSAADLIVRTSLEPNRPGRNLLAVDVLNTRRPAPAPITQVTVRLQNAEGRLVKLTNVTDSHWDGGGVNLTSGDLVVVVTVERPGRPATEASLPWTVNGPDIWRQPTVLSSARVAPWATDTAIAVAVLGLVIAGLSRWKRRRALAIDAALRQLSLSSQPSTSRTPEDKELSRIT